MKRWVCVIVPVLVLTSLIAWRVDQKKAEIAGQANQRAARMNGPAVASLAPVQIRDITRTFEATGSLEAPLNVKIAPKITGRIELLDVREGDRVRKGQVLVRIDSSEVEANVQQQRAALAEAQFRLAQAQMSQNPSDVAVNTQIQQQKASVSSAKADYNQARKTRDAQVAAAAASVKDAESKIDNATAVINSAKANLENAKTKYNRVQSLHLKGFVSTQVVDDAKATQSVQESALEMAKSQLKSANATKDAAQQQWELAKGKGEADIEAAYAKLVQARASLEYAKANTSQKSAYRQSIAALKASVAAAQASLRSAESKRQDTVLISPLDGYVTGRYSDPGAIASPTQPILSVQFMKQIWVTVSTPEEVCVKLHIGQPVKIKLDAFPGKTFEASIIQINPAADPQSRQFSVRVIMSNSQNLLKPGMFAHVSMETDRVSKAVVVPREAVLRDKTGSYVVVVNEDHKAQRVIVTPGAEDDKFVCVNGVLQPGQNVVTMCGIPIKDGQMVVTGGRRGPGGPGGNRRSGGKDQ
ncbi:MAG: efflux RND transporter periplasmic adaptor subunit [Armatimonadota bacterium]|nr:efflux RND transporter periplasmic adaptor subunit [bacterium]